MISLQLVIQSLRLQVLSGDECIPTTQVQSACVSDMLSEVMAHAPRGCLWITHQSNENVIAIGYFKELAAILLPNHGTVDEEILEKAKAKNIPVLSSPETAYDLAGQLDAMGLRGRR